MTKAEILEMIEVAEAQRKMAYRLRVPRAFIQDINRSIRDLTGMLQELEA